MGMKMDERKKEFWKTLILFSCIVFGILILCGTVTSGLHMVDDHEFLRFTIEMQEDGKGIWELMKQEVKRDGGWRFRPLYYPVRVIQTVLFGTDIVAMSAVKGLEVVLTCMLVYYVARGLKCSPKYSFLATSMVLAGPQAAVCWKLGTPELTATWVFALAILWLLKYKETKKARYNVGIWFCMLFDTLYKENYVLLIPLIMLIYIYFYMEDKELTWKNLFEAVKANFLIEFALGVLAAADLLYILLNVGTSTGGYIGVDSELSLWFYIKVFLNNFRLHLRIGQYGFFVLALLILFRKNFVEICKKLKWEIFLTFVIIIPQMIMFAKSGLEERYVIPWVYGVTYFFVIVLGQQQWLKGKERKLYSWFLGILVAANLILTCYEARYFAYRGEGISKMLETVQELSTPETKILSAFAPYDESDKTTSYWFYMQGRDDIYVYRDGECKDWYREGKGETISLDEIDIVMTYNDSDRHFIEEVDIDFSEFEVTEYNTMRVAVRKEK